MRFFLRIDQHSFRSQALGYLSWVITFVYLLTESENIYSTTGLFPLLSFSFHLCLCWSWCVCVCLCCCCYLLVDGKMRLIFNGKSKKFYANYMFVLDIEISETEIGFLVVFCSCAPYTPPFLLSVSSLVSSNMAYFFYRHCDIFLRSAFHSVVHKVCYFITIFFLSLDSFTVANFFFSMAKFLCYFTVAILLHFSKLLSTRQYSKLPGKYWNIAAVYHCRY